MKVREGKKGYRQIVFKDITGRKIKKATCFSKTPFFCRTEMFLRSFRLLSLPYQNVRKRKGVLSPAKA